MITTKQTSVRSKLMNRIIICSVIIILSLSIPEVNAQAHYLLVSSRNGDTIQRFNGETGEYIDNFVSFQSGGLSAPQDILLINGKLLVTGRFNEDILFYDGITGDFLGNFSSGYSLDNPTKMTLGPDSLLYISQWGQTNSKVVRFRSEDGTFVDEFTSINVNAGMGHTWDANGNLYVASFGSSVIKKFDTNGVFIEDFINSNPLSGPIDIWFSEDYSSLFVSNWNTNSVLQYNGITGNFESTFISQGLGNAEGITFGPDELIYLCDRTNNRVNRYNNDGSFIDIFAIGGGLNTPNSLIFVENKTTSLEEQVYNSVSSFELQQNYPNPFNPVTTIKFSISENSFTTLIVYDVLGNKIANLVNEEKPAGEYEINFDAQNIPSGVYLYTIISGSYTDSKKMILIK